MWGWNCPAVDLDFLMVEYNIGRPVGLVEYKHQGKFASFDATAFQHPTYRALAELANVAGLPFLQAFYWPDTWAFRVVPVNDVAKQHFASPEDMTERQYVQRLYKLRRLKLAETISNQLNDWMPEDDIPF